MSPLWGQAGPYPAPARYLKERDPGIQVVAVEPDASPLLSGGQAGPHGIQGIGANFIPQTLDRSVYDQIVRVRDRTPSRPAGSWSGPRGCWPGISSGAALWAAGELARLEENRGKTIVALLPDSGDRYLSSPMFVE